MANIFLLVLYLLLFILTLNLLNLKSVAVWNLHQS